MLPHFVDPGHPRRRARPAARRATRFEERWFDPFVEFRFPRYGTVVYEGIELELRQAIEPWNVLGEEVSGPARRATSTRRSSGCRCASAGLTGGRHVVACNGRALPLTPTGVRGEFVAGVRFRAWAPPSALHPTIGVHAPLTFDLVDTWSGRSIGGCTYHVSHPGGRSYDDLPGERQRGRGAALRALLAARPHAGTDGRSRQSRRTRAIPCTLDLRWQPGRGRAPTQRVRKRKLRIFCDTVRSGLSGVSVAKPFASAVDVRRRVGQRRRAVADERIDVVSSA